jgi:uncharacterized membrane protein
MIQNKIVELLVRIRTSFTYVALAILLPISWVILHRYHLLSIDNDDMTYLNLTLSIMAEVQGVVLLIYTSKIAKQQDNLEDKIEELEDSI